MSHAGASWGPSYRAAVLVILVIGALNACAVRQTPPARPVADATFERYTRAASLAFAQGEYARAADLYRHALKRAYARDDRRALVDTQYNLAVVLLHAGFLEEARAAVEAAKVELTWQGQAAPAYLLLLEATILYRMQEIPAAQKLSEHILTSTPAADLEVIGKTHFLRGLMAAEAADRARLEEAIAALDQADSPQLRADQAELRGYLALAESDWDAARQAFDTAAELRRASLDYPRMARALARAGEAAERDGRQQGAAIYYLRAGRSAFQLGQRQQALDWLTRAQLLARQVGDAHIMREVHGYLALLKDRGPEEAR